LTIQSLPYVTFLGLLFGSTLVVSRFSVGQFEPSTYIGLRLILASLGHVAVYAIVGRRHWPRDRRLWRLAALLGVLGTAVPMNSIVTSLKYQSSGITSLLLTANPALTVILAHFYLSDEKLTSRKVIGVILALSGAALLVVRGESGIPGMERANPLGYGLVLLAMVCSSSMTVYARKHMRDLDAFDVASVRMLVAALVVMPLSVIFIGFDLTDVTREGYLALGYASLAGTFSGMMLAFYVIKRFGATASAMTAYVIPVVAGAGGVLFLGETVTLFMLVGLVLIILGIATINRRNLGSSDL
jgi:drug/metabolite transporter (DMT)-like permease